MGRWANILVDCPGIEEVLTYAVPLGLTVQRGDVVNVPVGRQRLGGIVLQLRDRAPENLDADAIRDIQEVIAPQFLPPQFLQLIEQVSEYYYTPLMRVIQTALPPGLLRRSQVRIRILSEAVLPEWIAFCSPAAQQLIKLLEKNLQEGYSLKYLNSKIARVHQAIKELRDRGWVEQFYAVPRFSQPKQQQSVTLLCPPHQAECTKRQLEILRALEQQGGQAWLSEFTQQAKTTAHTLKKLEDQGYVVIAHQERLRLAETHIVQPDQPKSLTPEQTQALTQINQAQGAATYLLHGVTGSGKTEVYLQAIAPRLAAQQSALILVPEIGLTPQLTDRFRSRFGDRVRVYHSDLSEGERYDCWRLCLSGEPQIIIGTRSAVFLPLPQVGLMILDEEHDHSFKESQRAPTYHARTVAKWRSRLENCPLVLGSATPALETWVQAQQNGVNYLTLPHRIQRRPLPNVAVVDMRRELQAGNRSMFSAPLHAALSELPARGEKAMLFIPRRGHSTFVQCRSCGLTLDCPHCDVSLSYHFAHANATPLLRCHYCNHVARQPRLCPDCQSPYLKFFGSGTQQVVQALAQQFPKLRVIRFDSDTTSRKGAHRQLLEQFTSGHADLLVGTQMLTKGIDIAEVTLVGILAADGLLKLADYRAGERAFQTLTQVAGRAGRGDKPGQVILQTYNPEHPLIAAIQNHDYAHLCQVTLPERRDLRYPPYQRLVLLRVSGLNESEVEQSIHLLAQGARSLLPESCEILGPAPAVISRINRRYRWQVLLKFPLTETLPDLRPLAQLCPRSVSLLIDVDPLELG